GFSSITAGAATTFQTFSFLSAPVVTALVPSALRPKPTTGPSWAATLLRFLPSAAFQTCSVLSSPHETIPSPLEVNAAPRTGPAERRLPLFRVLVGARRQDALAVAVVRDRQHGAVVREELDQLAVEAVDRGLVVGAADCDARGLGVEADAAHLAGRRDRHRGLAVGERPDLDRLVGAAAGDLGAVLAQRQAVYRGAVLHLQLRRAAGDVPHLHRLVGARGDDLVALGGEVQRRDRAGVAGDCLRLHPLGDVEDVDRVVGQPGRDGGPVGVQRDALHRGAEGELLDLL